MTGFPAPPPATHADVLIENFKVGGLARFGLDYPTLAAGNPGLVYASITGFGQDGPRASQPGYDFLIQGMSGIMDLTGDPHGEPQKIGVAFADIMTGLYAVIAIQAALHMRAEGHAWVVAVEHRRQDAERQRGGGQQGFHGASFPVSRATLAKRRGPVQPNSA